MIMQGKECKEELPDLQEKFPRERKKKRKI